MNSVKQLILEIKIRPRLFLGKKSIFCLRAYLDGWCKGNEKNIIDMDIMFKFQKWVEILYNNNTHSWDRIICFYSQDEFDALDEFFKLFDLFLDEQGVHTQKPPI